MPLTQPTSNIPMANDPEREMLVRMANHNPQRFGDIILVGMAKKNIIPLQVCDKFSRWSLSPSEPYVLKQWFNAEVLVQWTERHISALLQLLDAKPTDLLNQFGDVKPPPPPPQPLPPLRRPVEEPTKEAFQIPPGVAMPRAGPVSTEKAGRAFDMVDPTAMGTAIRALWKAKGSNAEHLAQALFQQGMLSSPKPQNLHNILSGMTKWRVLQFKAVAEYFNITQEGLEEAKRRVRAGTFQAADILSEFKNPLK